MSRWRRNTEAESWDGGEWVDVGSDGRWRPSAGERTRSGLVLALTLGFLLILAAVASVDGGDPDEDVASASATTAATQVPETTTTPVPTTVVDPASLAGEPPPPGCEGDARNALPLRERSQTAVLVLNGTSRSGHAGSFTDKLRKLDYTMSVPANAGRRDATQVEYLPGHCAEASRLVTDLEVPGAELAPMVNEEGAFLGRAELLVTLGRDST